MTRDEKTESIKDLIGSYNITQDALEVIYKKADYSDGLEATDDQLTMILYDLSMLCKNLIQERHSTPPSLSVVAGEMNRTTAARLDLQDYKAPTDKVARVLEERGKRYGRFGNHARIATELKNLIRLEISELENEGRRVFKCDHLEALDMIAVKIARIIGGDPEYPDNWDDIAGYAILVGDRIRAQQC